ncbi:MAG: heme o synthase [Bacteriovoracia bacterium]
MSAAPSESSAVPGGAGAWHAVREQYKLYREFAKSGVVALVLISVLGGYLAGHPLEKTFEWSHFLWTLIGIFSLASGSSALNQLQEVAHDAQMPRTQSRPLPTGRISRRHAVAFCFVTLATGFLILGWLDSQVMWLGAVTVFFYNFLYTLWWKKHWAFAAIPGAIPGALPILMGYAAASGEVFTRGGLYLFFILFFWQMPHFWALALRYQKDYALGGFPTLPVVLGAEKTVAQITMWSLAYVALAMIAPYFLMVGEIYMLAAIGVSAKILWELRRYAKAPEGKNWLRFFLWINFSLIILIAAAVIDLWWIYLAAPLIIG